MDNFEKMEQASGAFEKLHTNEPISEEEMLIVKDIICGNVLFSNILMDEKNFWLLINSTVDTIHENYNTILAVLVKKAFCMTYGLRYEEPQL